MSQRLLISLKKNITKDDNSYDYIYTEKGSLRGLLCEWCSYDFKTGFYLGPWKVSIRDYDFFDQFQQHFLKIKEYIPQLASLNDCWTVREKYGLIGYNQDIAYEMLGAVESIIEYLEEEDE